MRSVGGTGALARMSLREASVDAIRRFGVNRTVLYSILTRGTQGVAALASIILVGRFLDRATQGYYFTILSLVAFVQLAEFGLTYAVMQSASHETGHPAFELASSPGSHVSNRLAALLRGATRFNAATTWLGALLIAGVGTTILRSADAPAAVGSSPWALPWAAALFAVAGGQLLNPRISLLEGAGFVTEVWRFRLQQEIVTAVALGTALVAGWGLWAISVTYAVRAGLGVLWLNRAWRRDYVARLRLLHANASRSYWQHEVWPFQWRIGASALSGYLIFQFFTPLMFTLKGPTIAGQFGMTLALTNGLLTVTTAWLNSQAPLFGQLIARRAFGELDRVFARSLKSSLSVVVVIGAVMSLAVVALDRLQHPLAQRLLPPAAFALFVASTITNHVVFAMAIYLRAHRREPLMISSIAGAVVTPIVVSYAGRHAEVTAIAGSYLGLTVLGLGVTTAIYWSRSRAWHSDSYA